MTTADWPIWFCSCRGASVGERHVHRVVRREIVPELPRATQQIDVGVPPKIEVGEVSDGLLGSLGGNFAHPDEASERLGDLDVDQMRRVEFVIVSEQACLDTHAKSSLE